LTPKDLVMRPGGVFLRRTFLRRTFLRRTMKLHHYPIFYFAPTCNELLASRWAPVAAEALRTAAEVRGLAVSLVLAAKVGQDSGAR